MPADMTTAHDIKRDIQAFWGAVYRTAYADSDAALTPGALGRALDDLEDMFRYRDHLAVTEMPLAELAGRHMLEVGSGAGGHSALFANKGARVTALDLTGDRARATRRSSICLPRRAAPPCRAMPSGCRSPTARSTSSIPTACCTTARTPASRSTKCSGC
jgi:hypothetical protein